MHKKILRLASLLLVLMLCISMLPAFSSHAASSEHERISKLVTSTYKKALRRTGRSSFHGWCGAAVDWQMQLLGITTKVVGSNGCDKYDQYRKMDYTSGGYSVTAYPASRYGLEEALNAITKNGTVDVYNIMVGFQWTNTAAGRKYGHATFIYAIIDGIVYFNESFGMKFNGKYYAEGKCITGTIEQFAKSYNSWAKLDGVIYFGTKDYTDECERLPSYLYATVTQDTVMYTAPCTPDVDDRCAYLRSVSVGERLSVTGLYRNTKGEYWYQVEDSQIGYVRADDTAVLSMRYEDVTVNSVKAPTVLTEGSSFSIKGNVTGEFVSLVSVRAQIYRVDENGMTHVMTTHAAVNDNEYKLYKSSVGKRLSFRLLGLGNYHYELAVVVSNHYYAYGSLQTDWQTVKLWSSDFQVVEQKGETANVTFDACGGTAQLNAAAMNIGQPLGTLPTAQRDGYIFDGWYTESGELVDTDFVLEGAMTLYAQWIADDHITGWYEQDGRLYYVENGVRPEGFFTVGGITYHHNADGFVDTGWTRIEGELCYFHANGAMVTGWLYTEEGTYYMGIDGTRTIGWIYVDGNSYYLDQEGLLVTGPCVIDGIKYIFAEDGTLLQIEEPNQPMIKHPDDVMSPCDIGRGDLFF